MNIDDNRVIVKMFLCIIETTKNKRKMMIDERSEHRNSTIDNDYTINAKQLRTQIVDQRMNDAIVIIEPSSYHSSHPHFAIDQLPMKYSKLYFRISHHRNKSVHNWHRLVLVGID